MGIMVCGGCPQRLLACVPMDYDALYRFRFRDIDQAKRVDVWKVISKFIYEKCDEPEVTLDGACGLGEFINSVPSHERWALDLGINGENLDSAINFQQTSFTAAELPVGYFDLIFLSNVLEHLQNQYEVNDLLVRAKTLLGPQGQLAIMGPNFKYCVKEYFDCADHFVPLTHISVSEHLAAAGYEIQSVIPRFLPYSFRSKLPAGPRLIGAYLRFPAVWRILGKQFLIIARPITVK